MNDKLKGRCSTPTESYRVLGIIFSTNISPAGVILRQFQSKLEVLLLGEVELLIPSKIHKKYFIIPQ